MVNRLNKNYDGELNLSRDMITDSKKSKDGDITLYVRDLEIDDGEKIDSIILAYDEDHDGYNVLLMQRRLRDRLKIWSMMNSLSTSFF